jgi:hypothetical protein
MYPKVIPNGKPAAKNMIIRFFSSLNALMLSIQSIMIRQTNIRLRNIIKSIFITPHRQAAG